MILTTNSGDALEEEAAQAVMGEIVRLFKSDEDRLDDYREPGMSRADAELEWLYENAPVEVTDDLVEYLHRDLGSIKDRLSAKDI